MNDDLSPQMSDGLVSADEFRSEGSVLGAIIGGIVGAAIGAGIWAGVGIATDKQVGWIAILVGVLAGLGVRFLGKGKTIQYGIIGAVLAFIGVVVGNILTVYLVLSRSPEFGPELAAMLTPSDYIEILTTDIQGIDLLFYGLALYTGFSFAVPRERKR